MNIIRTEGPRLVADQRANTRVVWSMQEGRPLLLYQREDESWVSHNAPDDFLPFIPDTSLSFVFDPEKIGDEWVWRPRVAHVSRIHGDD